MKGKDIGIIALLPVVDGNCRKPDEAEAIYLGHAHGNGDMALPQRFWGPDLRTQLERAANVADAVLIFVGKRVTIVNLPHINSVAAPCLHR